MLLRVPALFRAARQVICIVPLSEEIVIEAGKAGRRYWQDLWRYRELFVFFAWRDIAVRYKQTVIGVAWALLRPVLNMIVLTFVFGNLAGMARTEKFSFHLLVLAGQLPWQFFSSTVNAASQSLVGNARLLSKIYFPRLMLPASTLGVGLADFLIAFILMLGMMVWFGVGLAPRALFVLPFLLSAGIASLALGTWFAALNVTYRDFRFIIPIVVQAGLFLSPVGYPSDKIAPGIEQFLYNLNPLVGVIDGFRWALLGDARGVYWEPFLVSQCLVVLVLISGLWYFRRMERTFADVV
ncbi:MAG: lipopolysaccharide transport system permease protein [Candidatus Sumerlaeota bacterium]|nr:lipopolysaccharide transport system permease protein [Candidatus Sumerlaeota bacterium]